MRVLFLATLVADVGGVEELPRAPFVPLPWLRETVLRPFEFMESFPDVRPIVPDRLRIRKDADEDDAGLIILGVCAACLYRVV